MALPRLLHIEDDAPLRRSVLLTLADEGFEVLEAADGEQGLRQLERAPDGVLLDLGLPDIDGFELCGQIRQRTANPVLILSVQRAATDVARALAAGADDYLVKPFPSAELARRFRALLAPAPAGPADSSARDPDGDGSDQVGGSLGLTVTEARLLSALAAQRGSTVDREALLRRVWGIPPAAGPAVLVARIHSLRGKLEAAGRASIGSTSTGYLLPA